MGRDQIKFYLTTGDGSLMHINPKPQLNTIQAAATSIDIPYVAGSCGRTATRIYAAR